MFSLHKNSYLQLQHSYINPKILNKSVDAATSKPVIPTKDVRNLELSIKHLGPEQTNLYCRQVDVIRRRQAFGRWDLPILRRALHSKNDTTVLQAVCSICDLISDPEKGYAAIRLRIPLRISDLLLHEDKAVREQTAVCLAKFAELYDGRLAIVENKVILTNIVHGMNDGEQTVKLHTAILLEMLTRSPIVIDCLIDAGFLKKILLKLQHDTDELIEYHLETLKSLCYNEGKCKAIELGAFKTLIRLLETNNYEIIRKALDCLMVLTSIETGQKLALEENLLRIAVKFLYHHRMEICTSAASLLVFCTIQTKAKILAAQIENLPRRLIKLLKNPLNESLQLYCIKTLTNIAEHPQIRHDILNRYGLDLIELQTKIDRQYIEILSSVLNWLPY